MIVQELINLIGFKVDKGNMKQAESAVNTFGKKLQGVVGSIAITGLLVGFAKTMSDIEQLEFRFGNLFGSIDKGKEVISGLLKSMTMEEMKALEPTIKQFIDYGDSVSEVNEQMEIFDTISDTLGIDLAALGSEMSRIRVRTKLTTREFITMSAQGIPIISALAESTGKSSEEIRKMGEAGKISYKELMIAFRGMTKEGGKLYIADKRFTKTLAGSWEEMKRILGSVGNSIRQYILPPFEKFIGFVLKVANYINNSLNPSMKAAIFYVVGFAAILQLLLASLALLNPHFVLIAGAILLALAALALLVEEVILYTQGQDTMIGKVLPPWVELKKKIKGVRDAIIKLWDDTEPVLNDMRLGWVSFLEYLGGKLFQVTKEGSSFRNIMKWVGNDLVKSFEDIKQLFDWIEKSVVFKWITGKFAPLGEKIKEIAPKVGGFVASQMQTFLPSYQPPLAMAGVTSQPGGSSIQKNINVDSTINVTLPAGTPEFHKRAVQESAKQAVLEVWNFELRNLTSDQPNDE